MVRVVRVREFLRLPGFRNFGEEQRGEVGGYARGVGVGGGGFGEDGRVVDAGAVEVSIGEKRHRENVLEEGVGAGAAGGTHFGGFKGAVCVEFVVVVAGAMS